MIVRERLWRTFLTSANIGYIVNMMLHITPLECLVYDCEGEIMENISHKC
jgi:hypothetical protein